MMIHCWCGFLLFRSAQAPQSRGDCPSVWIYQHELASLPNGTIHDDAQIISPLIAFGEVQMEIWQQTVFRSEFCACPFRDGRRRPLDEHGSNDSGNTFMVASFDDNGH
jgi:hypothetical protein